MWLSLYHLPPPTLTFVRLLIISVSVISLSFFYKTGEVSVTENTEYALIFPCHIRSPKWLKNILNAKILSTYFLSTLTLKWNCPSQSHVGKTLTYWPRKSCISQFLQRLRSGWQGKVAGVWICGSTVLGNPKGAAGALMSVLGELVRSPKGSSCGKQAFCQSSAEYLSASLIEIVCAFWQWLLQ